MARVGYLDWTLTKCQSREAISVVPKWGQRFSGVNLPETDRGNVPCSVASFTTEQTGQILAGVTHLVRSESLCIHKKHPLQYPVCDGGCVAMPSTMMKPDGNGGSLDHSLILALLSRKWTFTFM